ncbi:MAG: DUF3841 domain-containing protein [Clostridia bacterium]|nr:DUF3841 domain-containing protein [Clostridia bacterium]
MRLITFQSYEALKFLINNGYLICDEKYINMQKSKMTYDWVIEKMQEIIKNNTEAKFPMWAWVKCFNGICPPKRKGESVKNFNVKITFNKNANEVFVTDFKKFSFILNNTFIPSTKKEKEDFDQLLKKYNITDEDLKAFARSDKYPTHRTDKEYLEICSLIRKSFDKVITTDSNILQGCVWDIKLSEVESIEILTDTNTVYGSLNYIRSNGKRFDWRNDYYKTLK